MSRRRLAAAPVAALLLAACASGAPTGGARAGWPAAAGPAPCVYGPHTSRTHLPDGRTLAAAWDSLPVSVEKATLVPGASDPDLFNRNEVARALAAAYPPELVDAGVADVSVLQLWIGPDGRVQQVRTARPAAHAAVDAAAVRIAARMVFRPAVADGCAVAAFIHQPIHFAKS